MFYKALAMNSINLRRAVLALLFVFLISLFPHMTTQDKGGDFWSQANYQAQAADSQSSDADRHVRPRIVLDETALVPGSKVKLGVIFDLEPHWHIYYKEAGDAGIPTQIEWHLPQGFKAGPLLWEKPSRFNESGIITYGYSDSTIIATELTVPSDLKPGQPVEIKADLKWLTCNNICIPGLESVKISVPVAASSHPSSDASRFSTVGFAGSVKDLSQSVEHSIPEIPPVADSSQGQTQKKEFSVLDSEFKSEAEKKEENPLSFFLFALVGGFILNFMPCVLPVIAIKVMSFLEQADEEPARVRNLGLVFTAGIISAFMVLALIVLSVRAAGQSVGWGFQFQYPGFVIGMCVIVLLLSLSLFGMFYVAPPPGQDGLDKLANREGYLGTFFKGVLATTLSTPCTAPFLGAALGFAFAQPPLIVLGIFFASGLGMALPYVFLTANPKWMKFLPKPGAWMEKFKECMGFILLATVIWLLGVLASQVGSEGVMWTSFFLLSVSISAWIISRYTDLSSTTEQKVKAWSAALIVFGLGFYLFVYQQKSIMQGLTATNSASNVSTISSSAKTASRVEEGITALEIAWVPFSVDSLNEALNSGKTVFLDFTADWCLTCKVNEKTVLDTAIVKDKFKELDVLTMKADWTNRDPDITKLLSRFKRSGVPLYVVFPAGRPGEPHPLPDGILTADMVIDALKEAGASQVTD